MFVVVKSGGVEKLSSTWEGGIFTQQKNKKKKKQRMKMHSLIFVSVFVCCWLIYNDLILAEYNVLSF